jgi:hypothetical protein
MVKTFYRNELLLIFHHTSFYLLVFQPLLTDITTPVLTIVTTKPSASTTKPTTSTTKLSSASSNFLKLAFLFCIVVFLNPLSV